MKIRIKEPIPVPEDYTFTRCDKFTREEFINMYKDEMCHAILDCLDYLEKHPKDIYDTDDILAIREISKEHYIGSLCAATGKVTTKRYAYDHDCSKY